MGLAWALQASVVHIVLLWLLQLRVLLICCYHIIAAFIVFPVCTCFAQTRARY
jgi:hypothetical protein